MFMCQFMGTTIVILTLWNMKYTEVCSLFVLSASLIAGAKVIIGQLNANDSSLSFYIPRPPRPRQWPSASTTRACAPTVSSKDNTYLIVIAFGNIFVFQFHNFTIFSQLGILQIQFRPFGKANVSKSLEWICGYYEPFGFSLQFTESEGGWRFECQHGEDECYGNKVQACLLHQVSE